MSIELKQAAQDAAEAIDWLLKNIRLDTPQLSGKSMGNAEKCASALRSALAQQPATGEPVAWMHPSGGVLQALLTGIERNTYTIPLYTHPAPSVPAKDKPVLTIEKEPDYWSGGHFHKGTKPHINPMKVWSLPIGTELYTRPAPSVPNLIEKAISSGYFDVLPVKATIPMCKAGWAASGGELTFQQIGHIYEEMYKARPLPDDSSTG